MELKLFAEIHISFKRSNLHSDETNLNGFVSRLGMKKKNSRKRQFWNNLPTN